MDNRYEIAEQNGMSREFADWFFDNKKAGCGNVWFMMMAAMWEGWQGRAAMLQGAEPVTTDYKLPELTDSQCLEFLAVAFRHASIKGDIEFDDIRLGLKMALESAPQQEA
ncbi:hypothetical protein ITZ04_000787 [Escherichia coli]|nr:hypothetical protein [Escherichia coli]